MALWRCRHSPKGDPPAAVNAPVDEGQDLQSPAADGRRGRAQSGWSQWLAGRRGSWRRCSRPAAVLEPEKARAGENMHVDEKSIASEGPRRLRVASGQSEAVAETRISLAFVAKK